jgi:hypothetical protein
VDCAAALHGAKHGSMKATFVRPTVVLDHSSQLQDIKCSNRDIETCFKSSKAFEAVKRSWHLDNFNLVTYHMRCGDETSGKRTFFHAKQPVFNPQTSCVRVAVIPVPEEEALDSGEINWGTYQHPDYRKRVPVKGHVRITHNSSIDTTTPTNMTEGKPVDITRNATALKNFFQDPDIDTSHMHKPVPESEELDFISMDGTVSRRDAAAFFQGLWNGIKNFFGVRTISIRPDNGSISTANSRSRA